jgi:hypothetical protein
MFFLNYLARSLVWYTFPLYGYVMDFITIEFVNSFVTLSLNFYAAKGVVRPDKRGSVVGLYINLSFSELELEIVRPLDNCDKKFADCPDGL